VDIPCYVAGVIIGYFAGISVLEFIKLRHHQHTYSNWAHPDDVSTLAKVKYEKLHGFQKS
jgi:hypothetical protein